MSKRKSKQSKQCSDDMSGRLKKGQRMSMRDAMSLVDDDLPDGAYWAMVHDMAGLEYGDGFDELLPDTPTCEPQPKSGARK